MSFIVICDTAWFYLNLTQLNWTQPNSSQLIFIMLVERIKVTAATGGVQAPNK